jgi:hypothetical protein
MMTISPRMIDEASVLMCGGESHLPMYGVENHRLMRGVANRHPRCGVASNPICVAVNRLMFDGANGPLRAKGSDPRIVRVYGRTPAATGIVAASPILARAMAPTTCCRMGSAGLTFGGKKKPKWRPVVN